jgi:Cu(I)/Ag(I) efflux system periplasmic protein CusF
MKSTKTLTLTAALLAPVLFAFPAAAQSTAEMAKPAMKEAMAMVMSMPLTDGEIKKVSKDTGKLTIKHGEIKNLDMPPMTMVFVAKDPTMLDRVAVGDKVKFTVIEEDGKMVVTDIQTAN